MGDELSVITNTDVPAPPRGWPPLSATDLRGWNAHVIDAGRRLGEIAREAETERARIGRLRPDLAAAERTVLDAKIAERVGKAMEPVADLETMVEAQVRHLTPGGVRRHAILDADPARLAALNALVTAAPDSELADLAAAALDRRDPALAELVRMVASQRPKIDRETQAAIARAVEGVDAQRSPALMERFGAVADLRRAMLRIRSLAEQAQHGVRRTFSRSEIETWSQEEYESARRAAGRHFDVVDDDSPPLAGAA